VAVVVFVVAVVGSAGAAAGAPAVSISCSKDGALYACALPSGNPVAVPVTFDQILDGVTAAGGTVTVPDPAMWITGWGGAGANGTECCGGGGHPNGGRGASGGVAQLAVSPATYEQVYGTSSLYYAVGGNGPPGPGDSAYGGWGGGATAVFASPPPVSSPGQAPPFWDVVLVAGGGGGGGGGGGLDGRSGGVGGTAISTFFADASAAGAAGSDGSGGNGLGGNPDKAGSGGQGGCSGDPWCDGADGVGGFGGFGSPEQRNVSTSLFSSLLAPEFNVVSSTDYDTLAKSPVESPGMGGGSTRFEKGSSGQPYTICDGGVQCGGGGGAGFGGGGAGDYQTNENEGGLGGGGGGSYAAVGTCDATGAPAAGIGTDSKLAVYVDPGQDCSSSLAALRGRTAKAGPALGPAVGPELATVVEPANGIVSRRATQKIVVRTEAGAVITNARLNGKDVTARLRPDGDGTWRGTLGRAHGVAAGANTLVVRVERGADRSYATTHWTYANSRAQLVQTDLDRSATPEVLRVEHLGNDPVQTRFTLGGTAIPSDHVSRALRLQTVRLSASSGLRHGLNRLVVTAHTRAGAFQQTIETVRIANRDPIAGAGPDLRAHVDARVVLDGSSSVAPKGGARHRLSFRWTIASAPHGSKATLTGGGGESPQFRPDLPGRYTVQLTLTAPDGQSSSDAATVTVDALPNTRIDTLATSPDGTQAPGIQLDSAWFCPTGGTDTSCLFQPNPAGNDASVQLLVLDRDTLAVATDQQGDPLNRSYSPSSLANLNKAISELVVSNGGQEVPDTSKLVVLTLGSGTVTDMTNFSGAVSQIGMPAYGSSVSSVPAPFSVIGIPGMTSGKAWHNFGLQIGTGAPGALVGYIKDSAYYTQGGVLEAEQRVFTFPDVVGFETRVVDGDSVQVQVQHYDPSTRSYTTTTLASFPTTDGGLGIVNFDPYTLAVIESHKWTPDTPGIDWNEVRDQLDAAVAGGDGVVIVSLGQMSGYTSEPSAAAFRLDVLPAIRALGGQPDIFARAVNDNGTYSFIGSGGQGTESSSVVAYGVPTRAGPDGTTPLPVTSGNLTGELQRGSDGRFVPSQADPSGIFRFDLDPVLYQAPGDWPLTPAAGATTADGAETALAWLAQCKALAGNQLVVQGLSLWAGQNCTTDAAGPDCTGGNGPVTATPDPSAVRQVALSLRSDYYDNANLNLNDALGSLTYACLFPKGVSQFTQSDFQSAQAQLDNERNDLTAAGKFFGSMESTIANSQASVTQAMTNIASDVQYWYFKDQPTVTVTDYSGWTSAIFSGAITSASTLATIFSADTFGTTELFYAFGLFAQGGNPFQTLITGPQTSSFTDIEAWLLTSQDLQNTTASVDEAVINSVSLQQQGFGMSQAIVASDWGRLDTVAANSQGPWSISSDELNLAANAFVISTRRQIWQGYAHQLWTAGYVDDLEGSTGIWQCPGTTSFPFVQQAKGGLPTGLGQGSLYWPVQTISTLGTNGGRMYAQWIPYVIWVQGSDGVQPPVDALNAIYQQPTSTGAGTASAGAFGPWFWPSVFDMTRELSTCTSSGVPQTVAGNFYGQTG
jgi:hypothetical protein